MGKASLLYLGGGGHDLTGRLLGGQVVHHPMEKSACPCGFAGLDDEVGAFAHGD